MEKAAVVCFVLIFAFIICSCSDPHIGEISSGNLESNTEQEASTGENVESGSFEGGAIDDQSVEVSYLIHSFFSLNDFLLYCSSGSTDVSIYEQPPKNGVPRFQMKEKSVINFWELFPKMDPDTVTFHCVEVLNDHHYGCGGITNNDYHTDINFRVGYEEDAEDYSLESVIKELQNRKMDLIVQGDFDGTDTELPSNAKKIAYITEKAGCFLAYPKYKEMKSGAIIFDNSGVIIYYKKYCIEIGPGIPADTTFYEDDDLIPILALFKEGEERTQALEWIMHYLDSKLGIN